MLKHNNLISFFFELSEKLLYMDEVAANTLRRFGENIAKIKKNKKLSYRKIAANCDIEHSDIKRYVDGKINPTLLSIVDLAKGLDINPKDLFDF